MTLPESLSLDGKIAVITGSSRGIGRAIARELASRGASVVINYLNSSQAAYELADEIQSTGGLAEIYQADVSDKLIMMMTEDDWDIVQATNLKSTFNCSKAAVRFMMRKRYGRIINITSVGGQMGNPGQTNYSASKAGQIGFTKALAREVGSRNITVNAIAAGYVETDIWEGVPEEARAAILSLVPLGRKGEAQEIADAVAFLASDQAAYITGQVLGIDGGMAMM
jgi:3-oxoacyl-[acyl-carrier protein] reductase